MATIIPSIIPESFEEIKEKISLVVGLVDIVQIDVMDGIYTPKASWPYRNKDKDFESVVAEAEGMPGWKDVDFEVDLLVSKPEEKIEDWVRAGASRIVIHIESTTAEKVREIIDDYRGAFVEVGLALKPGTSNDKLEEFAEEIDFVQFMGNNKIGFHGVELDEKVLDKVREFREVHPELPIACDIGVNAETAGKLALAGVTRLVSGNAVFDSGDVAEAIEELKEATSSL